LERVLTRRGRLPASHPASGQQLASRQIFVAPPDHHLSVVGEQVAVTQDPPQRHRPSINLLFESAARSYKTELIGVLLTGMLSDGTLGLQAIKHYGGTTIIQDPEEAAYPSMPKTAQDHCVIDYCLPLAHIAPLLQELIGSRTGFMRSPSLGHPSS
jgi:two-component system, chemotaxis family, protein-glutamate methylesterase/glutaminase